MKNKYMKYETRQVSTGSLSFKSVEEVKEWADKLGEIVSSLPEGSKLNNIEIETDTEYDCTFVVVNVTSYRPMTEDEIKAVKDNEREAAEAKSLGLSHHEYRIWRSVQNKINS